MISGSQSLPLGNWKQVLGLILCAAALDALVLLEIPWDYVPARADRRGRRAYPPDNGLQHGPG